MERSLRTILEKAVVAARGKAEQAAMTALKTLAVDKSQPFASHTKEQRRLRNELRAKARQFGGGSQSAGFNLLIEDVAYQQWHMMLFARLLAENRLLIRPSSGVAVTLEECNELAQAEGLSSRWQLATRYAGHMLPGIFGAEDPSVRVPFTPEGRRALENILAELPSEVFTTDDGLGWVYQFWQSTRRKEISASGRKIEKLDLAAYSQLFTEDYMVRFLLENSLGAWWTARHPDSVLVRGFKYLRFGDDGTPAAGAFSSWPERASELTVLDPCCGSGHFLVAAFDMIRRMRMEEEGLDDAEAAIAVLRDNLFGLEIDPRCVQIAAFSLVVAAWRASGYRVLPVPNVACSGVAVSGQLETWIRLARDDANMRQTLERLHGVFANAPHLGSLINPADAPVRERMFVPDFAKVAPLLESALTREKADDPVAAVFGKAALGAARAAQMLGRKYTLVTTNVPYLARSKQGETLRDFVELQHAEAKVDLATAFVQRCRAFSEPGGSYALVTPQNWLSLVTYQALRRQLLTSEKWNLVALLGMAAFSDMNWWALNTALTVITDETSPEGHTFSGVDASEEKGPQEKARLLKVSTISSVDQRSQLRNPDARVSFTAINVESLLAVHAVSLQGISTADLARYGRFFWEVSDLREWEFWAGSPEETSLYGGRSRILGWTRLQEAAAAGSAYVRGSEAWDQRGVAVGQMRSLPATLYTGDKFDTNVAVILPKHAEHLPAIWEFCSSPEFNRAVRQIDPALKVTNATLVKVPFELERWQVVAERRWGDKLPEPQSDDPTQWIFEGDPAKSEAPLQVAVARLLGYQWPRREADNLSHLAVQDGILLLSPTAGQEPAPEQLRRMLAVAYGAKWSAELQTQLLRQSGFADKGLDTWLRDGFFMEHCKLFEQRPFIWQVWDGQREGFSALVNYHKLDMANLNKLIYTYLGEWIRVQRVAQESGTPGSDARLSAALELQKALERIRDGEDPYDIYVRWKPKHKQPIGWNPDLDDGIRLNIRPFVTAGVLRRRVNLNWNKDRGRNPDGSERVNDDHLTLEEKRVALKEVLA